jgi:transposase
MILIGGVLSRYGAQGGPISGVRTGLAIAAMFTLIETAKLNNVDPQAWLADVLCRINDHPAARLHQLLPWHWKKSQANAAAA